MKTIKYQWTGEYRPPKKDEWYFFNGMPMQAEADWTEHSHVFILRREEIEEEQGEQASND